MLTQIHIRDLAIVRSLELELAAGMTALTGETGAGKSILIDALGLALGDRADHSMIRTGCGRAEITAVFDVTDLPEVEAWIDEQALVNGAECILRRVLVRNGRSRAFINGSPVPLQSLQTLGRYLVDIHGQHAHQSLLRRPEQRHLLDEYAGHQALAGEVADLYRGYSTARERLAELQAASRERTSRLDLLHFQAGELDALQLGDQELQALDRDHARLSNVGRLQEIGAQVVDGLYESETSVQTRLVQAVRQLEELASLDPSLTEAGELLDSASIQVQEAASGIRHYLEGLELDPARLQQLESRLAQIHDMARKYRVPPEQLPERLAEIDQELAQLKGADVELERLSAEVDGLRTDFLATAKGLSIGRGKAAKRLARTVTKAMQTLGMGGGKFAVALEPLAEEKASAGGLDRIEFLVSANPGQPLQPLARVASGGELSRISLAIQVATARCGRIPTLIFDEVDVGIGGGVAEIVGQMLRTLGETRQILCVTHLPQVAAMGQHHLQVSKSQSDSQTRTGIAVLSGEQRVNEIARMLGGLDITDQTLAHAREMVAHSQGS